MSTRNKAYENWEVRYSQYCEACLRQSGTLPCLSTYALAVWGKKKAAYYLTARTGRAEIFSVVPGTSVCLPGRKWAPWARLHLPGHATYQLLGVWKAMFPCEAARYEAH